MTIIDRPQFKFNIPFPEESPRLISICGDIPSLEKAGYHEVDRFLWHFVELARDNSDDPITLLISSDGGDIDTAKTITDHMSLAPFPIHTVAREASSAAALIFVSGSKGHRYMFKNSHAVLHLSKQVSLCPGYGWPTKKYCDLGEEMPSAQQLIRYDKYVADILLKGTDGKLLRFLEDWEDTPDEIKQINGMLDVLEDGVWLSSERAIEYGFADHVIDEEKFKELFLK